MIKLFLIFSIFYFFCSCSAQKSVLEKEYYFQQDDLKSNIVFNKKNKTFTYTINSPYISIQEVQGKWSIVEDSLIVLNTDVNSDDPILECQKGFNKAHSDSVLFDLMYIDSTTFKGSLYPSIREDSSLLGIIPTSGKTFINRNNRVNKVIVDGDFITLLDIKVDFNEYNVYRCLIKPDQYPYFDSVYFKVKPDRIINIGNEEDYYILK